MVENRSRGPRAQEHGNHWSAPIAAEHAEGGMPFQGCVEVWFDNMEDYEATMASPEWQALEADGVNGFDMAELHGVSSPST
jgi:hypothetical protein